MVAAARTMIGKGIFKAKMAKKLAAAMAQSKLFFRAREPIL